MVSDSKSSHHRSAPVAVGDDAQKSSSVAKKKTGRKMPRIDPPPVDMILRYPIEVWVSAGEAFVPPEGASHDTNSQSERVAHTPAALVCSDHINCEGSRLTV